jgi:hypothetical protein
MKYLNKIYFKKLDFYKKLIVFNLQVLGVASIWGYSEIFKLRHGYDTSCAIVTICFMFLSSARILLPNIKYSSRWTFVKGITMSIKQVRSDSNVPFLMYYGFIFNIILDFVLQILGTASIWAYSQIFGCRTTPIENHNASVLTMFFSVLSLIRYGVTKLSKFDDNSNDITILHHLKCSYDYFEAGLIGQYSVRKIILICIIDKLHLTKIHIFSYLKQSQKDIYLMEDYLHMVNTITYIQIISFMIGIIIYFTLHIVLEILGAGGAIWGCAEIFTLRKTPTSIVFKILSGIASYLVFTRTLINFYYKHIKSSPSQIVTYVSGSTTTNPVMNTSVTSEEMNGTENIEMSSFGLDNNINKKYSKIDIMETDIVENPMQHL